MEIKKAMVLCAGFGRRLQPLTINCPKPLLKIGNETLLSNTLKFLEKSGIEHAIINVHYLSDQIISYINNNKFNLKISLVEEKNEILDTGGGILNAINNFSGDPFLVINPDTIWNFEHIKELGLMQKVFFSNENSKCCLLLVNKEKSFDKYFKGDFNLKNNLVKRNNREKKEFKYIYTGMQIMKPEIFSSSKNAKVFSINRIWDKLIEKDYLYGVESNINFFHVSTIEIYNNILKKNFKY